MLKFSSKPIEGLTLSLRGGRDIPIGTSGRTKHIPNVDLVFVNGILEIEERNPEGKYRNLRLIKGMVKHPFYREGKIHYIAIGETVTLPDGRKAFAQGPTLQQAIEAAEAWAEAHPEGTETAKAAAVPSPEEELLPEDSTEQKDPNEVEGLGTEKVIRPGVMTSNFAPPKSEYLRG